MNFWKPWEAHLKFSSICSYQALYCKRNPKFIWRFKNFKKNVQYQQFRHYRECYYFHMQLMQSTLMRMLLFSDADHSVSLDADTIIFRWRSCWQLWCWCLYFQMQIMLATLVLMLLFSDADYAGNFDTDAIIFRCRSCWQFECWCYYFQMQTMLATLMLMLSFSCVISKHYLIETAGKTFQDFYFTYHSHGS